MSLGQGIPRPSRLGYVSNLLKSVLVLFDYHKVTVWLRDGFRPKLPGSMGRFQWFAVGFGPFFGEGVVFSLLNKV
jgi:hypothetical protein